MLFCMQNITARETISQYARIAGPEFVPYMYSRYPLVGQSTPLGEQVLSSRATCTVEYVPPSWSCRHACRASMASLGDGARKVRSVYPILTLPPVPPTQTQ